MAEIDVKIKGDDSDFKRKLAESGREAQNFSGKIKESFAQVKDGAADMMKEEGLGKIINLFGPAGLAVGVAGFGAALVDAFKEGISSAINFEDKVAHLKLALGVAQGGMAEDIANWAESISGAAGSVDQTTAAFEKLKQAGMGIEEAKNAVLDLQNAALQTDESFEGLTDAFVEMKSQGEITPRFFKEFPAIAAIVKNMLGPGPVPAPGTKPLSPEAQDESLMARVKARGGAQWMLQTVLPSISPGGMQSQARITAEATELGQLKDLGVQYEAMEREIGTILLPTMKDFTAWLKAEMPVIAEDLKGFAQAIENVIHFLGSLAPGFAPVFGPPTGPMRGYGQGAQVGPGVDLSGIWSSFLTTFQENLKPVHTSFLRLDESADKLNRALDPK